MAGIGLEDISLMLGQQGNLLLQQFSQATALMGASFDSQMSQLQQQPQQQQPIVRSPTSTLAEEGATLKSDSAALAAAYRTRIALASASPATTAGHGSNQARGTPAARLLTFINSPLPTPTVHGTDQSTVQALEKKWKGLYGGLRNNSQAAAEVLMKQAQATSQLEELVQLMFNQLKAGMEDRVRLQQVLLQERTQLMAQAEEAQQLHQRLHKSEHRSTAVQVVTESLQNQVSATRDALETSNRERQQLVDHVKQLAEQLSVTTECRVRGDALISEQTTIIETLRQQLQEQASTLSSLAEDKAHLEAQLQGVLRAEQELTVHLRETHGAIEGQLAALRDQLKAERQKRAAVVKRRGELQVQVERLQSQVVAQQADMAALADRVVRSGGASLQHVSQPASSRATHGAGPGQLTPPSSAKPSGQSRPTAAVAVGAVHAAQASQGRAVAAGASASTAAAAAGPHQHARATLRPSSAAAANARLASQSPTTSGGAGPGSNGVAAVTRRSISSPRRRVATDKGSLEENTPGGGVRAAASSSVTLHVPSSLPSPEASFLAMPAPKLLFDDIDQGGVDMAGAHTSTPEVATAAAGARIRGSSTVMEPPSPPINLLPVTGRESDRLHGDNNGGGANRRRSLSPETSRASANAVQHARRATPATMDRAGRPIAGRVSSPSPAAGNTWLP